MKIFGGWWKKKIRGKAFKNLASLICCVNSEWKKITQEQCQAMIGKIPKHLAKVIQVNRNQVYEHWYNLILIVTLVIKKNSFK